MNPEAKDFFFNKQTIPKTMDERTPLPYSRDEIVNGRDGSFSKGRPCSHVLGTPLRSGFAACVHTSAVDRLCGKGLDLKPKPLRGFPMFDSFGSGVSEGSAYAQLNPSKILLELLP
ncbi:hypothetical protein AXG93_2351s1080 [Marchantia polymorpha subsp. ruderalis]|uniref:Uncharacterized protein n=1 Tax=Marchantia polymorpha subsp. ruderalis TaxID=1480154 RepID=A0A176W4S8_MARPO|nr:hypothetical protein AXG93_2351s1080 [Marchantia polymorpha subsp. ruderalis]